jgi:hypothetical protein
MSRLFQAYIAVDWSAAAKPAAGANSIWIGVLKRNVRLQLTYEGHNPYTRADAATLLDNILADLRRKSERVLIGFDFPLGFPQGAAAALKLDGAPWRATLDFVAANIKDRPDNANNRFQVAAMMNRIMSNGPFPFWGCPPNDALTTLSTKKTRQHGEGDVPEHRITERAAKCTSPVWKLYTTGSVGSQALTGMPIVSRLRNKNADFRIWPFETGWKPLTRDDVADVAGVIAEIYPSSIPVTVQGNEPKDAAQVRAMCEHYAALDEKGALAALFGPAKDDPRRDIVEREEGWILGAPL